MRRVYVFVLLLLAFCGSSVFGTTNNVSVIIDQKPVVFNSSTGYPYEEYGRTLVPIRAVLEAYGLNIQYFNDEHIVISSNDGLKVTIGEGDYTYTIFNIKDGENGGRTVSMDVCPVIRNDRTYMPIRPVLEAFGAGVGWDNNANTVIINSDGIICNAVNISNVTDNAIAKTEKSSNPISTLSTEQRVELNKLISNMEEHFAIEEFDVNNPDFGKLIDFALSYTFKTNGDVVREYDSYNVKIPASSVEKVLNDFFGIDNVKHTDSYFGRYMGDYYLCPYFEGSYNDISQVNNIIDNKDGTYTLKVSGLAAEYSETVPTNRYLPKEQWKPAEQGSYSLLSTSDIKIKPNNSSSIGFNVLSYKTTIANTLNEPGTSKAPVISNNTPVVEQPQKIALTEAEYFKEIKTLENEMIQMGNVMDNIDENNKDEVIKTIEDIKKPFERILNISAPDSFKVADKKIKEGCLSFVDYFNFVLEIAQDPSKTALIDKELKELEMGLAILVEGMEMLLY